MGVQTPHRDPSANDDRPGRPRGARGSRDAASASASEAREGGESASSTAYVLEPGGPCNVYRWDAESGLQVLERVLHPERALGADLVQLPLLPVDEALRHGAAASRRSAWIQSLREPDVAERLAAMGPTLLALLLAQPANPPGARVGIRLLGAVHVSHLPAPETRTIPARGGAAAVADGDGEAQPAQHHLVADYLAVGVPTADETLAYIMTLDDLPPALVERLQHALQLLVPEALAAGRESGSWLSAEAIRTRYREARAAIRRAERAEEAAAVAELPGERLFAPRAAATPHAPAGAGRPSAAAGAVPAVLPAWRELSPITPAELRALGEAAYSAPEHLLRWIPHRFEHYLNELLLPDERVLFFAELPALTIRGWSGELDLRSGAPRRPRGAGLGLRSPFGRLHARHLHGGLLLITDRQILHVRDYAPPDVTLVEWGYLAHSWPLGRVVGVRMLPAGVPLSARALAGWQPEVLARLAGMVPFSEATVPPDRYARLVVALESREGIELVGAAFPAGTEPLLERAAVRIQRFVPAIGAGAGAGKGVGLRVVPHVEPWQPTEREARELETLGGLVAPEIARALEEATRAAVTTDEQMLVQARTPEAGGTSGAVPALLTLTDRRLLLARVPTVAGGIAIPGAGVQAWSLGALSSAVLQQSMLGSGLIAHAPHAGDVASNESAVERISVVFPSPLLVPFRALYTRLRQLLGGAPSSDDNDVVR